MSLKIGFYLTDVAQPDRGNTLIVPGSHLLDEIDCLPDGVSNPQGAEPVCVKPGTALIIDRRIWHSRSPNLCNQTRKVVWYGYGYRWLRPKDQMTVSHLYPQLDPIRRQFWETTRRRTAPMTRPTAMRPYAAGWGARSGGCGLVPPRTIAVAASGDGSREEPWSPVTRSVLAAGGTLLGLG